LAVSAAAELFVATHDGTMLSDDGRFVVFCILMKKFWIWDLKSADVYARSAAYIRAAAPGARPPAWAPTWSSDVPLVKVSVPCAIASRTVTIAAALYNQLALSVCCDHPFASLAVATYRCRPVLDCDTAARLSELSAAANSAKHVGLHLNVGPLSLPLWDSPPVDAVFSVPGEADTAFASRVAQELVRFGHDGDEFVGFDDGAVDCCAGDEAQMMHTSTVDVAASSGRGGGLFGASTGGGLFGAPAATGGGLFGAPAATGGLFGAPAATDGGLFGAPAAAGGGLFGAPAATGGNLFGAKLAGGLLGAPAAIGGLFGAPAASGGLFGATPAVTDGGLFLFGAPVATDGGLFDAAPALTGGLFGAPAATGGGLFGATPAATGGGLFDALAASGGRDQVRELFVSHWELMYESELDCDVWLVKPSVRLHWAQLGYDVKIGDDGVFI